MRLWNRDWRAGVALPHGNDRRRCRAFCSGGDRHIRSVARRALLRYPLAEAGLPTPWIGLDARDGTLRFLRRYLLLFFAFKAFCFWICCPTWKAWSRSWWVPCGGVAPPMTLGEPAFLAGKAPLICRCPSLPALLLPVLSAVCVLRDSSRGGLILDRILAALTAAPLVAEFARRWWVCLACSPIT